MERGVVVADVPNTALTDEAPVYRRPMREPAGRGELHRLPAEAARAPLAPTDTLLTLLAAPTIASKRWIFQQYDYMVRPNTIALAGLTAGVVRIKGTPKALAMSVDGNGRFCALDPRAGARLALAEASRNVACAGGLPIGATNCLNFGNPERPEIMWQFAEAVAGLGEACRALEIPITGGNVSLYNETDGRAILPTPVIGVVGIFEDASRVVTRVFPDEGLDIVLLGTNRGELGGSEYLHALHGLTRGLPPVLDLAVERALQSLLVDHISRGVVRSAHDCSEGGLVVTLAECCFEGGGIGASVAIDLAPADAGVDRLAATLFGESASRVVVTTAPDQTQALLAAARAAGVPAASIGRTGGRTIRVSVAGATAIECGVLEAEARWTASLANWLEGRAA